jgi:hypothetical protein
LRQGLAPSDLALCQNALHGVLAGKTHPWSTTFAFISASLEKEQGDVS